MLDLVGEVRDEIIDVELCFIGSKNAQRNQPFSLWRSLSQIARGSFVGHARCFEIATQKCQQSGQRVSGRKTRHLQQRFLAPQRRAATVAARKMRKRASERVPNRLNIRFRGRNHCTRLCLQNVAHSDKRFRTKTVEYQSCFHQRWQDGLSALLFQKTMRLLLFITDCERFLL